MLVLQRTLLPSIGQPSPVWTRDARRGWDAVEINSSTFGPAFCPLGMCNPAILHCCWPSEFGGGALEFLGDSTADPFQCFVALLRRELDKQDKEGCISSKGSCGVGDGPREGWLSAQLSDQALTVRSIWTLVEMG